MWPSRRQAPSPTVACTSERRLSTRDGHVTLPTHLPLGNQEATNSVQLVSSLLRQRSRCGDNQFETARPFRNAFCAKNASKFAPCHRRICDIQNEHVCKLCFVFYLFYDLRLRSVTRLIDSDLEKRGPPKWLHDAATARALREASVSEVLRRRKTPAHQNAAHMRCNPHRALRDTKKQKTHELSRVLKRYH